MTLHKPEKAGVHNGNVGYEIACFYWTIVNNRTTWIFDTINMYIIINSPFPP